MWSVITRPNLQSHRRISFLSHPGRVLIRLFQEKGAPRYSNVDSDEIPRTDTPKFTHFLPLKINVLCHTKKCPAPIISHECDTVCSSISNPSRSEPFVCLTDKTKRTEQQQRGLLIRRLSNIPQSNHRLYWY